MFCQDLILRTDWFCFYNIGYLSLKYLNYKVFNFNLFFPIFISSFQRFISHSCIKIGSIHQLNCDVTVWVLFLLGIMVDFEILDRYCNKNERLLCWHAVIYLCYFEDWSNYNIIIYYLYPPINVRYRLSLRTKSTIPNTSSQKQNQIAFYSLSLHIH